MSRAQGQFTIIDYNDALTLTGFIGSNLAKQLLDSIEGIHVIGFDNVNDYYDVRLKEYRLNQLSHYEGFTFIKADLADKDLPLKLACDIPSRILMLIFSRI